ncbi:MAG: sugar ABC transporter ATP-binding protein [Syntrophales bacterium]
MEQSSREPKNGTMLTMTGITKAFPGIRALSNVDFYLMRGSIMGLVGQNGAGKSTLIKILSGAYTMDRGEILIDNKKVNIDGVAASKKLGIVTVYQEFSLIPTLTVAENIFLGVENEICGTRTFFSNKKITQRSKELLAEIGIFIDPKEIIENLSRAEQQMVEIAKGFREGKKIYILDEPTASLAEEEVNRLFKLIRTVKEKGLSVVFVSHRLNEVLSLCDQVTVIKDGKNVGVFDSKDLDVHKLASYMTSDQIAEMSKREATNKLNGKKPFIRLSNFSRKRYFKNLSLDLYKGEVLGIGGLLGVGRSEFFRSILGVDKKESGEIYIDGRLAKIKSPLEALRYGIAYVTEDRRNEGLFYNQTIVTNISISALKNLLSIMGFIRLSKERKKVEELVNDLNIKITDVNQLSMSLSGGNQQKVVLARWLMANANTIIFDEPTVGIDVGAKAEIHKLISDLARLGKVIVAICTEIPELLMVSDKIVVLRKNGTFSEVVQACDVDERMIREMIIKE